MKKIILLTLSILLIGCSSNDDGDSNGSGGSGFNGSYVKATINGNSYDAYDEDEDATTTGSFSDFGQAFIFVIGGSRIVDNTGVEGVSFGITGADFDEVTSGFEISLDNNQGYIMNGYYTYATLNQDPTSDFDLSSGFFKVTSIDKTAQTVSGEFNFIGTDDDGELYTVSNGEFFDVEYTVN